MPTPTHFARSIVARLLKFLAVVGLLVGLGHLIWYRLSIAPEPRPHNHRCVFSVDPEQDGTGIQLVIDDPRVIGELWQAVDARVPHVPPVPFSLLGFLTIVMPDGSTRDMMVSTDYRLAKIQRVICHVDLSILKRELHAHISRLPRS